MNDLVSKRSEIWNQRLRLLMKWEKCSQTKLAEALSIEYGNGKSFTQKEVSRWTNVGGKDKNGYIGFPKYDTMVMIADHFHVDVGFLTGETDYSTFNIEALSKGTGLSSGALNNLINPNGHCFPADMYADWWSMFFEDDLFFLLPERWHDMCHAMASRARGKQYLETIKDAEPVVHDMQDLADIAIKKRQVDEKNRCEDLIDDYERHYWSDLYELQNKFTDFCKNTVDKEVLHLYLNYEERYANYLRKQKLEQLESYVQFVNEKLYESFGDDIRIDSSPLTGALDILLQCKHAPDPELEFIKQYHMLLPLLTTFVKYNHNNKDVVSIIEEVTDVFINPPKELSDSVKMLRGDTDISNFTELAESIGKVFTYISKSTGIGL